jgi:hypothetical protein
MWQASPHSDHAQFNTSGKGVLYAGDKGYRACGNDRHIHIAGNGYHWVEDNFDISAHRKACVSDSL